MSRTLPLRRRGLRIGLVGFDEAIHGLKCSARGTHFSESGARCSLNRSRVEAVPCAAQGPLLVHRSRFLAIGGFNETLSSRGAPSSLLDCELSARIWRAGAAVVISEPAIYPREASAAWRSASTRATNYGRCRLVKTLYSELVHLRTSIDEMHA